MEKDVNTENKKKPDKKAIGKGGRSATGKPINKVDVDPQLDLDPQQQPVTEQSRGGVVLAFGRMNPPTIGHEKLVHKVLTKAHDTGAKPMVFLSHSQDKKRNPLSYDDKVRYARIAFGNVVQKAPERTIIEIAKKLQRQFSTLILVVGSDRVRQFQKLLDQYNGREYKFEYIEVISAGERDPDDEGVSGMSATKMREAARNQDLAGFRKGLPSRLRPHAESILHLTRLGQKLHEELAEEGLDQLEEALDMQQRIKRRLIMRRYKAKIKRARDIAQKRIAPNERLKLRAMRAARKIIRKRVAGKRGQNYANLTPAEKMQVDKAVEKRKKVVKKLATRLFPRVKAAEFQRLKSYMAGKALNYQGTPGKKGAIPEDFDVIFNQIVDTMINHVITEKESQSLAKKADRHGIDYVTLEEVFVRGLFDNEGDHTAAFNRVNSFVAGGKTALHEDADLYKLEGGVVLDKLFENKFRSIEEARPINNPDYDASERAWNERKKDFDKNSKNGKYVPPKKKTTAEEVSTQRKSGRAYVKHENGKIKASDGRNVKYFQSWAVKAAHRHAKIPLNDDINNTFGQFVEAVRPADKQPVVIPAHNDAHGNPIPAKTVMRRRQKSIIDSGNVHDGDDQ